MYRRLIHGSIRIRLVGDPVVVCVCVLNALNITRTSGTYKNDRYQTAKRTRAILKTVKYHGKQRQLRYCRSRAMSTPFPPSLQQEAMEKTNTDYVRMGMSRFFFIFPPRNTLSSFVSRFIPHMPQIKIRFSRVWKKRKF